MGLATVEMEVCFPNGGGLAIQGGAPGAFVRVSCREAHTCTRFCRFEHQVGNLYVCVTSGASHICDQTCQQRVFLDGYTSQCRLSGRRFEQKPERCELQPALFFLDSWVLLARYLLLISLVLGFASVVTRFSCGAGGTIRRWCALQGPPEQAAIACGWNLRTLRQKASLGFECVRQDGLGGASDTLVT